MTTRIVVNPWAAAGRVGRMWPEAEARVRAALGAAEVSLTREPGHAADLARAAARDGVTRLVVVGGDGTVNEAANGLLSAGVDPRRTALGLLPGGTGGDLRRTLGLPGDWDGALAALAAGRTRAFDTVEVTLARSDGGTDRRHFVNVSTVGFGAAVARRVNAATWAKARLGGTTAFLLAILRAAAAYRNPAIRLAVEGGPGHGTTFAGPSALAAFANGRFCGGGLMVAPDAHTDDGLIDVMVAGDFGLVRLAANLPRVYRGRHMTHPMVTAMRGRRVRAEAAVSGQVVELEMDGEPAGRLPATFEVRPGALSVAVP